MPQGAPLLTPWVRAIEGSLPGVNEAERNQSGYQLFWQEKVDEAIRGFDEEHEEPPRLPDAATGLLGG